MRFPRPHVLATAALAALLSCGSALAAFPEKSITIVVPTAAGGANDAMARVIGQAMSAILKQPVIVDNKAGANGAIASEFVMRAPADGHTLMLGYIATHAMNPSLQKLRYDPVKDFEPVGMVGSSATLMVVSPSVKANNAKELVALLKATPDKFSYASAGNGTAPHFAAEMFKLATGTSMLHVPYKGSAPAVNDTIGGQTQVMFPSLFTAMPYVKSGKLKAIGVAGEKRSALMPDVPTLKEQGINMEADAFFGLYGPAGMPADVVGRIDRAVADALKDPAIQEKIYNFGLVPNHAPAAELAATQAAHLKRWEAPIKASGFKAE